MYNIQAPIHSRGERMKCKEFITYHTGRLVAAAFGTGFKVAKFDNIQVCACKRPSVVSRPPAPQGAAGSMETSAKVRFFGGTWSYCNLIFSFLSALPWRAAACGCILKKDYLEFEMQYLQFKFQVTLLKGGRHTPLSGRFPPLSSGAASRSSAKMNGVPSGRFRCRGRPLCLWLPFLRPACR